jgi:hypothetical protein
LAYCWGTIGLLLGNVWVAFGSIRFTLATLLGYVWIIFGPLLENAFFEPVLRGRFLRRGGRRLVLQGLLVLARLVLKGLLGIVSFFNFSLCCLLIKLIRRKRMS